MSQLAYNYKGQRFVPPAEAMFWRVRRIRDGQRGQLDIVRGNDGRPLIVPIDIDVDGFRVAVNDLVGRYRLDALDEHELPLADVDAAYVTVPVPPPAPEPVSADVHDPAESAALPAIRNGVPAVPWAPAAVVTAPFGTWPALPMPTAMSGTEYLLAEALRGQVQMFQMVTAALSNQGAVASAGASQMMTAAAGLVRAADGAAMPHRSPPVPPTLPPSPSPTLPPIVFAAPGTVAARNAGSIEGEASDEGEADETDLDDGDEDGGDDGGGEADMLAKMMTLADKVQGVLAPVADVARLVMGGMGGGVRNAAPDESGAGADGGEDPDETIAASDVAHLRASHILLVAHELGPDGSLFRRLLMAMAPGDRQTWTDRLCSLPFEDAVADAAEQLARFKRRQASRRDEPRQARVEQGPEDAHAGAEPGDGGEEGSDSGDSGKCISDDPREQSKTDGRAPAPGGGDDDDDRGDDDGHATDQDGSDGNDATPARLDEAAGAGATSSAIASAAAPSPAAVQARMMEIAKHLRVPEILQAQRMVGQIGGAERDAWIAKLMALPPAEAARLIRAELARRAVQ